MPIDLFRTFSLFQDPSEPEEEEEEEEEDWSPYFGQHRGHKTWDDLHTAALSVVLGEAGIGKTTEFRLEVGRLLSRGEAAFFLPLNQLTDIASWQLAMTEQQAAYDSWVVSDQVGYFFLDSVDEARLRTHADFEKALAVVQRELGAHLPRIRFAISSRVTDWSVPAVREAVHRRITSPIVRALSTLVITLDTGAIGDTTSVSSARSEPELMEPVVVALDPLSLLEAKRCAEAFSLIDPVLFWAAVSEGDYEFMATRPLDLRWMVALWNKRRTLGTYSELMEANIEYRLQEFNEDYMATGQVLSVEQLRAGAMELAAAAEYGDCAYFTLETGVLPLAGELVPQAALPSWGGQELRRLLATAIFDEASYGRVKFHHRSIREYLAAEWVARQLKTGVPLLRLQSLFVGRPYGVPVLVPARSAALSWLATLNVTAREWIVREVPEVFLRDGDPQGWDAPSAAQAFARCMAASKIDLRIGWYHSASLCMRIGRILPPGVILAALKDSTLPGDFKGFCYQVATHAKLVDCIPAALADYRDAKASDWLRSVALRFLKKVGTDAQRHQVLVDLKDGSFSTNELIAEAMIVGEWSTLTVPELVSIFSSTSSEAEYGSGAMVSLFKEDLLPVTDLASATLLLEAVVAALPRPTSGKRFARFPESSRPERGWLLDVLSCSLERVLTLLPPASTVLSTVCMEAAERVESQRDSGYTSPEEFTRLHAAIANQMNLRWDIALAIAHSEDIRASVNRLTWGANCLVTMSEADLPELIRLASNVSLALADREVWQAVAIGVAFRLDSGYVRAQTLRALSPYLSGAQRSLQIDEQYCSWRAAAEMRRSWKAEDQTRKSSAENELAKFKAEITIGLDDYADASLRDWLQQVLAHSFNLSGSTDYSRVDFDALSENLGLEIATAFKVKLKMFWPTISPPMPSDYPDGRLPWTALIGMAGLRCSFADSGVIAALSAAHVSRAAQLSVWNLNGPPSWFGELMEKHQSVVKAALAPWLIAEAQSATPGNGIRGTLNMVLGCKSIERKILLAPLVSLVFDGLIPRRETLEELIKAMREDSLLTSVALCDLCQCKLTALVAGKLDMFWLRIWMEVDAESAWSWYRNYIAAVPASTDIEITTFAKAMIDLKWLNVPLPQVQADVLLDVFSLLRSQPQSKLSISEDDESSFFGPPALRLSHAIALSFVRVRGFVGHNGLVGLLSRTTDLYEQQQLQRQIIEHAALDASTGATRTVEALRTIASPFLSEPKSEAQLYDQVVARLEEIRKNLEEGPFSERDLFSCGMPEKYLQRWLAAKFRETQNRRFSVHREEEVDDDKMTDIQLSCPAGNVCVEIKPVDKTRYSATTLTDTLKTQIVGQYLKGTNSRRGILVLMQLDDKTWDIPGGLARQPFSALVNYLDEQSIVIKGSSPGVEELAVFGIRCIV